MANTVKTTFEADTASAEQGFERVGGAAKKMGDDVGGSAAALGEHANGLGKIGEAADNSERNIIGVHDVIDGTATIMQGPGKQGIVAYLQGWADLAGGIAPLILSLAESKAGILAQAAASKIAAVGTKIYAGAQWLMNTALLASPLTWVVVGIVALIAVIVLIATKTDWFQRAWRNAWKWIKDAASNTWDFIKKIPGWIGSAFSKVAGFILGPFRAAFNGIARAWNNTIGRLSWSVPSWVPLIGGNSISVPNLPTFHTGGVVPGVVGSTVVAALQAGETVNAIGSSGGGGDLVIRGDGSALSAALVDLIALAVARRGGSPGTLGIRIAGAR